MHSVMRFLPFYSLVLLAFAACGANSQEAVSSSVPSGSLPILVAAEPEALAAGAELQLHGVGFSNVPNENLLLIDTNAIAASSYGPSLLPGASETLTFTLPAELAPGDYDILLNIEGYVSNALTITVTP